MARRFEEHEWRENLAVGQKSTTSGKPAESAPEPPPAPAKAPKPPKAKKVRPSKYQSIKAEGYDSAAELRFAGDLALSQRAGAIVRWGYHRKTLVLPGDVRYTPDFDAVAEDGEGLELRLYEVKGMLHQAAANKLKAAIETYPEYRFFLVSAKGVTRELHEPSDVPPAGRVV